ncbi:hypothetical protein Efla_003160 [Eimeria flavescens]
MRTFRVSPLVRRASPLGCGNRNDGLSESAKGAPGQSSSSAPNEGDNEAGAVVEPLRKALPTAPNHLRKSTTRTGLMQDPELPFSAPSTPTRDNMEVRDKSGSALLGKLSDADWAHAQLQQMWDDGELSPCAPLDRSLGYFSSASPMSTGKKSSTATTERGEQGGAHVFKHKPQSCADARRFISDVRALRQMAPFSSTEEQVLTRSQRRRSSANLLQQLVARQPEGSSEFQVLHSGSAPQCMRLRKRRASSPAASSFSLAMLAAEAIHEPEATVEPEAPPRAKGRRRLSPFRAACANSETAPSSCICSRSSCGRSSVGTGELECSCSVNFCKGSKVASPFQKLPPPSPSDFPCASPVHGSSPVSTSCCSPRRTVEREHCLQQQRGKSGAAGVLRRQSGDAMKVTKKHPHEGTPSRKSPRLSRGVAEPSSHPFQTPRSPSCSTEPSVSAPHVPPPKRDSQVNATAASLCWGTLRNQLAGQQRGAALAGETASQLQSPSEPQPASAALNKQPSLSRRSAVFRRASAAKLRDLSDADPPGCSSSAEGKATKNAVSMDQQAASHHGSSRGPPLPLRGVKHTNPSWLKRSRATAGTADAVADDEKQFSRQLPTQAASPTKQRAEASNNLSFSLDTGVCKASGAAVTLDRRRSTARRTSRVPGNAESRVCGPSSFSSFRRCLHPLVAGSREYVGVETSPKAVGPSPESSQIAGPLKRMPTISQASPSAKGRSIVVLPSACSRPPPPKKSSETKTAGANSIIDSRRESKTDAKTSSASAGKAASGLLATRQQPESARPARPFGRKLGKDFNSLQQRRSGIYASCSKIRGLPITKQHSLAAASAKQVRGNGMSAARGKCAGGAPPRVGKAPRCLRSRAALERLRVTSTASSPAAAVRQRREPMLNSSKRRIRANPQGPQAISEKTSRSSVASQVVPVGNKVDSEAPHADRSATPPIKYTSGPHVSQKDSSDIETTSKTPSVEIADCDAAISSTSGDVPSDTNCMALKIASLDVQCTDSTATPTSSAVVEGAQQAAQRDSCCEKSPSHERRRSSDPQYPISHKGLTEDTNELKDHLGSSMRRASSACAPSTSLEQRLAEQRHQHDALQEEWECRDREYQEKQQALLLEQQRKERLLAWEQREAELLKNLMVDEEDEGVLTTEELRVEVSRFLKGDLRFHSRADLLRVVKKFSEQTRTTTTTTSSRLNFAKVEQRVVPMAARQVHGPVPHERRRKSILRSSNGAQQPEGRRRSRGISFSPFNKVQLYMLDEHERASKEAAANLSQQGEQRQQMRQKLAEQLQLMLLRGDSDLELSLLRRELAELYDPDEDDELGFLSPTLAPGRGAAKTQGLCAESSQADEAEDLRENILNASAASVSADCETGGRLPFTVSPSWRQRPQRVCQASDAAQAEPPTEWGPHQSLSEHNSLRVAGGEGAACWEPSSKYKECVSDNICLKEAFANDENAHCNAASPASPVSFEAKVMQSQQPARDLPSEEPPRFFAADTARRPSVLRRRLSIVPNVHSP